ncbi:hypothetical protein EW026_g1593 [Hermanssonia centrifuga]|uniref:DUF6589 domain-containing protein n=1 Tax=Hermanssonia centrifuga TaxID=98765 RepID=A0A4S4KQV5_9APHY|nr:hypothetical protein EW026_g1593 [Hermanssonia centrifuga]
MGVWLVANAASSYIFTVLGRMGLCVSYTTTRNLLDGLSQSTRKVIQEKAKWRTFLLIYDNINRMLHVWDPEFGDKDVMDSGTAATFVELQDCDVQKALDADVLETARAKQMRKSLDIDVLYGRIKHDHLLDVMAVHTLSFLVQHVPSIIHMQEHLTLRLQTSLAIHCMWKGRKTNIYPSATSDHDEGSTGGNQKVLDDLMLRQLSLDKEEIPKLLTIVGGDQSTVEKVRMLKRFLSSCPHGYARYGWVLPLIQLWHMGWADLERILSTHWSKKNSASDISTFHFMNEKLGRKVKNVKRPDFYPAQALVFDTLQAEVLDCWQEVLDTNNLILYFDQNPKSVEDLLALAKKIVYMYMSTIGSQEACLRKNESDQFKAGSVWMNSGPKATAGDQVLGNTILRMRDSMLHYEFQCAVADGDIGRAMNIMAVWTFMFCGSGKSKYTNELLEIACNFEYEYSDALQEAILNNWLCNLTGLDGCWFPMDLLQEHNIKQLKVMSNERVSSFGSNYFKNVIAYNVRNFLEVKELLQVATGLAKKNGAHRRKKKVIGLKLLAQTMREHQLHRYREGRTYGHVAKDDFATGYCTLDGTTRISDFVKRTSTDTSDVHGIDEDSSMDEPGEGDDEIEVDEMLDIDDKIDNGNLSLEQE